ncbi:MAG: DUF4097 domain-containing protein [Lachnospiraceae bacterium]|nr:DUF4097 domain-containing protein [Lachnospiraceae bacterium]
MKGTKIWLVLAVLLVVAGGSFMAVGLSMGGSKAMAFDWKKLRFVDAETKYVSGEVEFDGFSGVDLSIITADVTISVGDKYMVEYKLPESAIDSIEVKDGVLHITEKDEVTTWINIDFNADNNRYVKITVPAKTLDKSKIKVVTGDVIINGVDYAGDIKVVTGDVSIIDAKMDGINVSGTTSDVICENVDVKNAQIYVTTGDVSVKLMSGSVSDLSAELKTVTGDVEIDGKEYDNKYTLSADTSRTFTVHTTTGDITVRGN